MNLTKIYFLPKPNSERLIIFSNAFVFKWNYLQGINMKILPVKALTCALLTTTLLFNTNLAFAEPTVTNEPAAIQQVVNLNESTIDDLVTLKGIGHKKAKAILAYREKIGDFKSLQELTNVKGIGEKILIDNKERLKI